jgi:hypothetical protein
MTCCLVAGTAAATNITIADTNVGSGAFFGGGPFNAGSEDNETEPGTISNQDWDLEGMFFDDTTLTLTLVGGWDFINGRTSGVNYRSGDIFLSTDGAPLYGATAPTGAVIGRDQMSEYGYEYVIDVDWATGLWQVYDGDTVTLVTNDGIASLQDSNPWRRASGGNALFGAEGDIGDYDGGGDGQYAFNNAQAGAGFAGTTHNAVTFDMSWLANLFPDTDPTVYFHFTEECGNDNLMGRITSLPPPITVVPEPASMALLGVGLLGLVVTRARKKRF